MFKHLNLCIIALSIIFSSTAIAEPLADIRDIEVNNISYGVGIYNQTNSCGTVTPNSSVTVSVTVRNSGDYWSVGGHGQCVIWIEGYDNVSSVNDNTFDSNEIFPRYSLKWPKSGTSELSMPYVSIEATETIWNAGEDNTLDVTFNAPSSGTIYFTVRATFSDADWNVPNDSYIDPWLPTFEDPQG